MKLHDYRVMSIYIHTYTVSLMHRSTPLLNFSFFFTCFSMRVRGQQQLKIKPPHLTVFHHLLHSNAVLSDSMPSFSHYPATLFWVILQASFVSFFQARTVWKAFSEAFCLQMLFQIDSICKIAYFFFVYSTSLKL